ncbi:MAG TPA: hypothetical protein VK034_22825 [Enhygromyxa sp.]|nr:hypothetical protein [Enhygromyxa sp.]
MSEHEVSVGDGDRFYPAHLTSHVGTDGVSLYVMGAVTDEQTGDSHAAVVKMTDDVRLSLDDRVELRSVASSSITENGRVVLAGERAGAEGIVLVTYFLPSTGTKTGTNTDIGVYPVPHIHKPNLVWRTSEGTYVVVGDDPSQGHQIKAVYLTKTALETYRASYESRQSELAEQSQPVTKEKPAAENDAQQQPLYEDAEFKDAWGWKESSAKDNAGVISGFVEQSKTGYFIYQNDGGKQFGLGKFWLDDKDGGRFELHPVDGVSGVGAVSYPGRNQAIFMAVMPTGGAPFFSEIRALDSPHGTTVTVTGSLEELVRSGRVKVSLGVQYTYLALLLAVLIILTTLLWIGVGLVPRSDYASEVVVVTGAGVSPERLELHKSLEIARNEMRRIDRRGLVLLLSGIVFGILGVAVFHIAITSADISPSLDGDVDSYSRLLPQLIRSSLMLVFIETIAIFLLRQYQVSVKAHQQMISIYLKRADLALIYDNDAPKIQAQLGPEAKQRLVEMIKLMWANGNETVAREREGGGSNATADALRKVMEVVQAQSKDSSKAPEK